MNPHAAWFSALFLACGGAVAGAAAACGGDAFTSGAQPDDASTGLDAGDGATPEAGGSGFCVNERARHFLCDDFDEKGGDVRRYWDTASKDSARLASLVLDGEKTRSSPLSLLATTPTKVENELQQVYLEKGLGRIKQATVAYDVMVEQYGSDATSGNVDKQYNLISRLHIGITVDVSIAILSPTQALVAETFIAEGGIQQAAHPLQRSLVQGQWTRVIVDLKLPQNATGQPAVKVSFDGATVLDKTLTFNVVGTDTRSKIGMYLENAPRTWKVRFENVTMDIQQ